MLQAYAPSSLKKTEEALSLAEVPAGARLAIRYKSNSNYDYAISIDDIEISLLPSCAVPTGLTVSNVTATTAEVAWVSEADAYALQYKTKAAEEWTDATEVTNPFTLAGLTELTTYEVRVKAICGEGIESQWTASVEFTTNCAVKDFPFEDAFAATLAPCWSNINAHGSNVWAIQSEGTNYYLRYTSSDNGFNHATLATPVIALPEGEDVAIMFKWINTGVTNVALQVSVDGAEANDLNADLTEELTTVAADWVTKRLDISAYAGKSVQFFFTGNGGNRGKYICIDDFQVIEKPCYVPTNLAATAVLGGANVTWKQAWDEAKWNLQYKAATAEDWTAVNGLEESAYVLSGLAAETEYVVQVQAVCGEDKTGDWTDAVAFTTPVDTHTSVRATVGNTVATKRVVNGHLLIERNGETFNAQGVSVQ